MSLRPGSVRARLTLGYTLALAAVLLVYAIAVFLFLRQTLYADLDRRLLDDLDLVHEEVDITGDGRLVWRGSRHPDEAEQGPASSERWLEVWAVGGPLLLRSATASPLALPAPAPVDEPHTSTVLHPRGRLRVAEAQRSIAGVPVRVRVARSEEPLRRELREVGVGQALGLPLALAAAGLVGYHLARRALGPVARMAARARGITADRLAERIPVENPRDELGELAIAFNEAFGRIERSFEQLRRFTADASHELRTPLTALRSVGEVGLQERSGDRLFDDVVGSMLEEADRLTRLVDTLMELSRGDAGEVRLAHEPIDLAALATTTVSHLEDLAAERGQRLTLEAAAGVAVCGDWLVLRQAAINVLDNAIKYSPPGTAIRVWVGGDAERGWIAVSDEGPGIPCDERERIFDRFYRIDRARSREVGGTGLGLALARWGVEAHGGRIQVAGEPGAGSTFTIVLPLADASSAVATGPART